MYEGEGETPDSQGSF